MKAEHPDALLFFRMGDFYELFFEDAVVAARALEIALTSRSKDKEGAPIPMCGVPHHAVTAYVGRLVKQGFRVALCEQMEDPRTAKGVVKREVVRVVTPGHPARGLRPRGRRGGLRARPRARGRPPSARPGSTPPPASSWSRSGRAPGAGSGCATSSAATRPARAPRAARARRCPPGSPIPRSRRRAIPRAELDDERLRRRAAARRELLAHFGVLTLEAFGCEALPAGHRRRRRRPALRARDAEARPHPRHRPAHPRRRGRPRHRRAHAPQPGAGREPGRRLAGAARCSTSSTSRARAMGARRAARVDPAAAGRARAASRTGSTRWRSWPSGPSSAAGCARRWAACRTSTASSAASRLGTASPRDLARPGPVAARAARGRGRRRRSAWLPSSARELKDLDPPARRGRRHRRARSSTSRRRRSARAGVVRDGRRRRAGRAARDEPRRAHHHRRHRGARAGAHGHRLAQGALQPRVRLLHRGQQVEPRRWCPADYIRKQTIAGGERFVTPELKEYEEKVLSADERILAREARDLRGPARARGGRRRGASSRPSARRRRPRRAGRPGRGRPAATTTSSRG